MPVQTTVFMKGALITGDALPVIDRFIEDAVWAVGAQALADVHLIADKSFRDPTPWYETQLMVERMAPDRVKVHDQDVVYGPWLEGVGSRNKTTQFKGYKMFRTTRQQLGRKIPRVIQPMVEQLIRRLGG
jgi:hypothetical protein